MTRIWGTVPPHERSSSFRTAVRFAARLITIRLRDEDAATIATETGPKLNRFGFGYTW